MTLFDEKNAESSTSVDILVPGDVSERGSRRECTVAGHTYEHRTVAVEDESTAEAFALLNNKLNILDEMAVDHPEWVPGKNPASYDFYQEFLQGTSMQYWRDTFVPHAEALYPLQRLSDAGRWFPDRVVDEYAMDIFTNAIDGIAIRARGAIHNDILLKKAFESEESVLQAVALGAGAGVPNINATIKVRDEAQKTIKWREYDLSYGSLEKSKELFEEEGIPAENVETFRADYRKAFALEKESVDIIDMLGLWEYLSTSRCKEAVRKLYDVLKPGGVFVVSNMLLDRPQLAVNQTVIGWPGVKPRTIDELIDIAGDAGMHTDSIRVTTSQDGVYAVMEIHKP